MNFSEGQPAPARRIRREDVLLALAYAALAWLLHSLDLTATGTPAVPQLEPWWPVLTVIGCAAVLFRRVRTAMMVPVALAAAVPLVLANSTVGLFLIFEAVFSLVLFGTARAARAAEVTVLGLCGVSGLTVWALTGNLGDGVTVVLLAGMILLLPAEWASNLRKAGQLARSESARAAAIRAAARDQERLAAREHELALAAERQDMARELHDVLSSRLSAIALQSGAALRSPQGSSLPLEVLAHVRQESVKGLEELNGMIRTLSTGVPRALAGSVQDLDAVVAGHRAAGMNICWTNRVPGSDELPSPVQAAIYRIAVEALVNAARHTDGARVGMLLERTSGGLRLMVEDDGGSTVPGAGSAAGTGPGTGTGLPSILARAEQLGGRATAGPGPEGTGWKVEVLLPVTAPQAAPEALQNSVSAGGTKV